MNKYTEQDLFYTLGLYKKAWQMIEDTEDALMDIRAYLDWNTLSFVKATRLVAEDMGLIDKETSNEDWIDLCKNIVLQSDLPLEEITIEEFVDLLYWQSIFNLIKQKEISDPLDRDNYISKFAPGLRTKFYRLKMQTICDLTTELGIKHLVPVQKETQK